MIIKKTPEQIERMAAAGAILVKTMNLLAGKIRPGVTTADLDRAAEKFIRSQGATPAFKGYRGFPGSICASPNEMIVHGIPGPYALARGDILSVDIGVVYDGWVADAARTFPVGPISPIATKLLQVTEESLFLAVEQCRVGNRMGDVSNAVQQHVEDAGFSIVRSLVGHGVGRDMHEEPQIPNYGSAGTGIPLEAGMVLAVEPMVTAGRHAVRVGDDHWAIYSQDGSLAAHFEFTIAVTAAGPRILTPWHEAKGGRAAAQLALAELLIGLEREGWEALVAGRGGSYYREHLTANAVMAFPFGVLTREGTIEAMESAPPWERFEIRDPQVVELGADSGVVVYRVEARRPGQEPYSAVVSSTFVREADGWKLAFHQQSPTV